MILHVTFSDGSNPWYFSGDRHEVAKHWRRWMKYHPDTALPVANCGSYNCTPYWDGYYAIDHHGAYSGIKYKHLGHALAALERLGGGSR